ncbi:hypothetical protein HK100_005421 [Physocladia obscura]|uniref:Uncharacterized protein n=1 Tax=Physocladia obscura TaxID=109957 RepID=A0AAD5ST53_9FUNG|nr:hypothetical protein HK100_005421 [Physocladia obscura]
MPCKSKIFVLFNRQSLPLELVNAIQSMNLTTPARTDIHGNKLFALDPHIVSSLIEIRSLVDEGTEESKQHAINEKINYPASAHAVHANALISISSGTATVRTRAQASRLRESCISLLARAYRKDEVLASVVCMQSASALETVITKHLASASGSSTKNNSRSSSLSADALYVSFFLEKIPSRCLSANTDTRTLDMLIAASPLTCAYYRTRGLVLAFRQEFVEALADFKRAIQLSRKDPIFNFTDDSDAGDKLKKKYGGASANCVGGMLLNKVVDKRIDDRSHALHDSTDSIADHDYDGVPESQLYFLRAATHHHYAVRILQECVHSVNLNYDSSAVLSNEQPVQTPSITNKCDEIILGRIREYRGAFNSQKSKLMLLARKSIRDYSAFLKTLGNTMEPFEFEGVEEKQSTEASSEKRKKKSFKENPLLKDDGSIEKFTTETVAIKDTKSLHLEFSELINSASTLIVSCDVNLPVLRKSRKEECVSFLMSISSFTLETRGASFMKKSLEPALAKNSIDNVASVSMQTLASMNPANRSNTKTNESEHFGTYHPLLMEAWHAIALNYLILGDFSHAAAWQKRVVEMQASVDGFPLFMTQPLQARSMSHSDYYEVLRMVREYVMPGSTHREWDHEQKFRELAEKIEANETQMSGRIYLKKEGEAKAGRKSAANRVSIPNMHTKRADYIASFLSVGGDRNLSLDSCFIKPSTAMFTLHAIRVWFSRYRSSITVWCFVSAYHAYERIVEEVISLVTELIAAVTNEQMRHY